MKLTRLDVGIKIAFITLFTGLIVLIGIEYTQSPKASTEQLYQAGLRVFLPDSERVHYEMPEPDDLPQRLALYKSKKIISNDQFVTIKVRFVNGTRAIYDSTLQDWKNGLERYTNLRFVEVMSNPTHIVSFVPNNQSWSYIGTDAVWMASKNQITMNLGWNLRFINNQRSERYLTANHEMGHSLGYVHTQSSPACFNVIKFNWNVLYAKFSKVGWNKQMVDQNYKLYSEKDVQDNFCDTLSLMCYQILPGEANVTAPRNKDWSYYDRIKLASDYPPIKETQKTDTIRVCRDSNFIRMIPMFDKIQVCKDSIVIL